MCVSCSLTVCSLSQYKVTGIEIGHVIGQVQGEEEFSSSQPIWKCVILDTCAHNMMSVSVLILLLDISQCMYTCIYMYMYK